MKKHIFEVPTLYGDHHVLEVRRVLTEVPGVQEVYASSGFRIIEVEFDEKATDEQEISTKLELAGYLGDWAAPVEVGAIQDEMEENKPFFRHSEVFENTGNVVSFTQDIKETNRPLWPCPGMGVIRAEMED